MAVRPRLALALDWAWSRDTRRVPPPTSRPRRAPSPTSSRGSAGRLHWYGSDHCRSVWMRGALPSAHRDEIAEHSIRGAEHCDHGAAHLIVFDETGAEQLQRAFRTICDRDDDHVGVERPDRLHACEIELEHVVGEALDRAECRLSR